MDKSRSPTANCPGESICTILDHLDTDEEHVALLVESRRFGLFRRKDDLLAEGVAAVFGMTGGEAELVGLCFHAGKFTLAESATWLAGRGFAPLRFIPITGMDRCRCL